MPGRSPVNVGREFPDVLQELKRADTRPFMIRAADLDYSQAPTTTGTLTELARYQFTRPVAWRLDHPPRVAIVYHESFTTDGTAGNQETFSLTGDIVDNPDATHPFTLYEGATEATEDSIDYSANSFDYTDDGTGNTLHAYYLAADGADIRLRKVAPGEGAHEDLLVTNGAVAHSRNQHKTPLEPRLTQSKLQPVFDKDWELRVLLDAPVEAQRDDATDTGAVATNMRISIPFKLANARIDGLGQALRHDMQARA